VNWQGNSLLNRYEDMPHYMIETKRLFMQSAELIIEFSLFLIMGSGINHRPMNSSYKKTLASEFNLQKFQESAHV